MKVQYAAAVAFLVALGYDTAKDWDAKKLSDRLRQLPERYEADKVPEDHKKLYKSLAELTDQQELTIEGAPKPPKEDKEKGKDKPEGTKPAKAPSKGKDKPAKAAKPAKVKKEVEKDAFGFRKESIRSKVLAQLDGTGRTPEEIAKGAGVTVKAAKSLLGWASRGKLASVERRTEYKLAKKS